jgi:hypothetical protein
MAVPFLQKVGFPNYKSSGSWEENETPKTSVTAIESKLLETVTVVQAIADRPEGAFLRDEYEAHRMPGQPAFTEAVDDMLDAGLRKVGLCLLNESPDYLHDSVKYRGADATLAYLLRYDLPRMLAERHIPVDDGEQVRPRSQIEIETIVLARLRTLLNSEVYGIKRYDGDAYQDDNGHINSADYALMSLKRQINQEAAEHNAPLDLDKKQARRREIIPRGPGAAWIHPLGQIASYFARRHRELLIEDQLQAQEYKQIATEFLNYQLANITGDDQYNALKIEGEYMIAKVPGSQVPECKIRYVFTHAETGEIVHFWVPSPDTPLHWAIASLVETIGSLKASLKAEAALHIGRANLIAA